MKITKEKIFEKYSDVQFKFNSYYKYNFTYKGIKNGLDIYATIGGDRDDIYRWEIEVDDLETLHTLEFHSLRVYKKGELIEEYSNFIW